MARPVPRWPRGVGKPVGRERLADRLTDLILAAQDMSAMIADDPSIAFSEELHGALDRIYEAATPLLPRLPPPRDLEPRDGATAELLSRLSAELDPLRRIDEELLHDQFSSFTLDDAFLLYADIRRLERLPGLSPHKTTAERFRPN